MNPKMHAKIFRWESQWHKGNRTKKSKQNGRYLHEKRDEKKYL